MYFLEVQSDICPVPYLNVLLFVLSESFRIKFRISSVLFLYFFAYMRIFFKDKFHIYNHVWNFNQSNTV